MAQVSIPITDLKRRRTRTYDAASDTAEALQAIAKLLVPAGTLIATLLRSQPADGWLMCDGQTLLKADYPALAEILRGSEGETATTFRLPDLRNRMPIGASDALALFAIGGAASLTLTLEQLPSHGHEVIDPGHGHALEIAPHAHDITDPGHEHDITDPEHAHPAAVVAPDVAAAGAVADGAAAGTTGSAPTGITVDSATTGITIDSAEITGTLTEATTGITVERAGGGQPISILPPYLAVNWMVRA